MYKHTKAKIYNAFSKFVLLYELQILRCWLFKKLNLLPGYYFGNIVIQSFIIEEF